MRDADKKFGLAPPSEGDLYKVVTTFGETFELRYGYYDDIDRGRAPDVIYPDFRVTPRYTAEGIPFATMMQDACRSFRGRGRRTEDSTCAECRHFLRGKEWFGLCTAPEARLSEARLPEAGRTDPENPRPANG